MEQGLIVSAHGRRAVLELGDGSRLQALTRGKKADLVVGDHVEWAAAQDAGEVQAVIETVRPRKNLLFRQDLWRTKSFAANLDQILMLVAGAPLFSESQLTRAMIAADAADIPLRIVHNKIDLPEAAIARERLAPYERMGCDLLEISVAEGGPQALATLQPWVSGRISLLIGASGTGKSSLLNLLIPGTDSRTGELSQALQAGRHTTTHTSWHWLSRETGTAVLDSPGFQEFGLHHIRSDALASHMPDFRPHLGHCRFHNCQHLQEPDCAITRAVKTGEISASRHRIYAELVAESQATRW